MHLLRRAHQFEYRNSHGLDEFGAVDLWASASGDRAVLVLRDVPLNDIGAALHTLNDLWLPYLLPADADVVVMALRPHADGEKARAVVLPLSA